MDEFKLKTGPATVYHIDEPTFTRTTLKAPPYFVRRANNRVACVAVCPLCDNSIQIIGLYTDTPESGRKPYGRHNLGTVPGVADYNAQDYLACPYSNPSWNKGNELRPYSLARQNWVRDLLLNHFDRAIYILSQDTGLLFPPRIAEDMLRLFLANEGWRFRTATANNLPWILAEADVGRPLFGRAVRKGSELYSAIGQHCPEVNLTPLTAGSAEYGVVEKAGNGFVSLLYFFSDHRFNLSGDRETVSESILFTMARGTQAEPEILYEQRICIEPNRFTRLCQTSDEKAKRNERLLEIARAMIR